jgi:murein DD-endopeptidase MepM/ murein hydrolase activator NlpD
VAASFTLYSASASKLNREDFRVIQKLVLGSAAVLALAACATSPATYYQPASYPPPARGDPNLYAAAPHAGLASELYACNRGGGANIGPIGARGEALLYTPYAFTPAGALLRNPTENACLSSGFGWRGTADGGGRQHSGLDLANPGGGFVFAAGDGWVATTEWRGGYGLVLELDHGEGVRSLYAHLSEINPSLQPGAFITAGSAIARMGMTGNATGVHLHYEISVDGLKVDPLTYGAAPVG